MARARNIKPGFFLNDELAEIEPLGRLLFAGLWTIADREGRLEDRPKKIKAAILPYDNCDINNILQQLHDMDFIVRYEINGVSYIAITNWHKHQNPHIKEAASEIPPPEEPIFVLDEHHTSTVQESDKNSTSPADSLNLIPDSLNPINNHDDDNARVHEEVLSLAQKEIVKTHNQEFGRLISANELDELIAFVDEGMESEVVCEALRRTRLQGKTLVKYALSILRNWADQGVTNMAGVARADQEYEQHKSQKSKHVRAPAALNSGPIDTDKKRRLMRSMYS